MLATQATQRISLAIFLIHFSLYLRWTLYNLHFFSYNSVRTNVP